MSFTKEINDIMDCNFVDYPADAISSFSKIRTVFICKIRELISQGIDPKSFHKALKDIYSEVADGGSTIDPIPWFKELGDSQKPYYYFTALTVLCILAEHGMIKEYERMIKLSRGRKLFLDNFIFLARVFYQYFPAKNTRDLCLKALERLEGSGCVYKTGSGACKATKERINIIQEITGIEKTYRVTKRDLQEIREILNDGAEEVETQDQIVPQEQEVVEDSAPQKRQRREPSAAAIPANFYFDSQFEENMNFILCI